MKRLKKILLSPWLALITMTLLVGIRFENPTFVESVRLRYFDTVILQKKTTQNNIITVNIDEATLDKFGQWPFPRDKYAEIIDTLYAHNAGMVVFNVLMPEQDRFGKDLVLASVLKIQKNVVLPSVPSNKTKNDPRAPGSAVINSQYADQIVQYPGLIANVPQLENAAGGIGIVSTLPEIDGVNRRIPLVVSVDGKIYPSISMEALRVAAGDSTVQVKLNENGVEKMRIPKFGPITTDNLGRVWIDWSQQNQSYSYMKLPQDLNKAIVIVGPTAAGIANPLPTAKGAMWSQDVQAAVLGTMINGVVIQRPDWADGAEILATVLLCFITLLLARYTHGYISIIVLGLGSYYGSIYLFDRYQLLIDVTFPLLTILLTFTHGYVIKFVSEWYQKQQIKKQFGTYLSPALVEKLQRNPELLTLGGESKELSIMFTDVRGFTTISEHYGKDVQGLTKIMNRYMTAMTEAILKNNGTLDKYIGDAQMAFWNAPIDEPNHAKMAVKTALQMMESLDEFNKEIAEEGVPAFGMGLGINTDVVVVGNMGSSQRFDYTCLGDGVNLASRLEGQSKPYGVRLVIGPKTAEYIKDEYPVVELDCIAVKGKTMGVKIFTLGESSRQDQFLDAYYGGDWDKAIKIAEECIARGENEPLEQYYKNMVERMKEGKPESWDGTYRATSK